MKKNIALCLHCHLKKPTKSMLSELKGHSVLEAVLIELEFPVDTQSGVKVKACKFCKVPSIHLHPAWALYT